MPRYLRAVAAKPDGRLFPERVPESNLTRTRRRDSALEREQSLKV